MRKKIFELFTLHPIVSTDTRNIKLQSLFFALKGQNFNGNLYALEALEKGAAYAIVDEKTSEDDRIILVEDALLSLQELANDYRKKSNFNVIGITGSNGKTTTKELLFKVFSHFVKTYATPGNFNNHIGLPLTILQTPPDTQVLILEMGDNKLGDIAELCAIAEPNYGLITNVGKDHIEGFGSFENNVLAKKELFDFIVSKGYPFYYELDDSQIAEFAASYSNSYGYNQELIKVSIESKTPYLILKSSNTNKLYATHLYGDYNYKNILATLAFSTAFNFDIDAAIEEIATYIPQNNRSQIIEKDGNTIICDAYNANPSSMEVALQSFAELDSAKKKIAILGDMFELGHLSTEEHLNLIKKAENFDFETIIFVGANFYLHHKNSNSMFFETRLELENYLEVNTFKNALFLLKASRGIALEKCVDFIHSTMR